ncbi:substrate-binding periplasmic protein [Pseudomonas aeruginosa]
MKLLFVVILWLCGITQSLAAEEVTLFCYQRKPPYVLDENPNQGLYFDLAHELSQKLPQYTFVIRSIPRARLDYLLIRNELKGLVVGANPDWFSDASRHNWTIPFIDDANLLVSRSEGKAAKLPKETLVGLRVGLIEGHHYPDLKDLLWSNKIVREDAPTEHSNLQRLSKGWIDATIVGERTMAFYLRRDRNLHDRLYIHEPPLTRYQRQILVPAQYAHLVPELNSAIETLKNDTSWQNAIQRYR